MKDIEACFYEKLKSNFDFVPLINSLPLSMLIEDDVWFPTVPVARSQKNEDRFRGYFMDGNGKNFFYILTNNI